MRNPHFPPFLLCAVLTVACVEVAPAQVFGPGDNVIAIDRDPNSSYPGGESPLNVLDNNSTTKYLNFGAAQTGFIVNTTFGASVVQSFQLTTANDAEERDPASYILYGTNDPITSADNSLGDQENWIEISSGLLALPSDRETAGPIVDFANGTSFTSYKLVFPTLKDEGLANSMQIADAQFFTGMAGTGDAVLSAGDFIIAITDNTISSQSDYPGGEPPTNVIDGTPAKYLNFGDSNSGFIVWRADGMAVAVNGFTITTANDAPERDPSSYEIYGTNDEVTSPDNSTGSDENWTLVASGDITLPMERDTEGDLIEIKNMASYTAYRVFFPTLAGGAGEMQIGEMTFVDDAGVLVGDVNCDGVVDLLDVAPFVDILTNGGFDVKADINEDGVVDLLDVSPFVDLLSGS